MSVHCQELQNRLLRPVGENRVNFNLGFFVTTCLFLPGFAYRRNKTILGRLVSKSNPGFCNRIIGWQIKQTVFCWIRNLKNCMLQSESFTMILAWGCAKITCKNCVSSEVERRSHQDVPPRRLVTLQTPSPLCFITFFALVNTQL